MSDKSAFCDAIRDQFARILHDWDHGSQENDSPTEPCWHAYRVRPLWRLGALPEVRCRMIRPISVAAVITSPVVALRVEFRLLTDAINGWGRPW